MTTSDGVTLRHPPIPMVDVHPRLDIDTISILSSQSDSVQHLSSYIESDDEGKGLVGSNSSRLHDAIAQSSSLTSTSQHQPSAFKKDWAMYLTKPSNGSHNKHRHHHNESSSEASESDDDESSSSISDDDDSDQDFVDDPWTINTVQREYYTKQFKDIQPDITKLISGNIAKEFFERSRLLTTELSQIWNLSDVNHDGALSLAEFCTAMHLVVLRVNGFELPDELPPQLQPYTPLIDLSDSITNLPQINEQSENWATFKNSNSEITNNITLNNDENPNSPKQFSYGPPIADNHRIVAPVALRLSPPPPLPPLFVAPTTTTTTTTVKPPPPPPPPRAPGRTASIDVAHQPMLPPRTIVNDTPQRNVPLTTNHNSNSSSSTNTTPYLYNRTRPSIASTPQQSDPNILLGQIRDLIQPDHLQELASIISTPSTTTIENLHTALNQTKTRNSVLKAQLKHWEDRLTDLIDKRISLELQYKLEQQQQQQQQ
ncbi:unnamed protein product [Adineta steineri]|uniref:Uncharacterized protein n=1 Tax=Adineta steineri TaxID=433720 RepID=A0A815DQ61_9BILA|nr:unnamed protein product [Adineta steineri]CAF1299568.1 unnamed protein product [Adineta steineri]